MDKTTIKEVFYKGNIYFEGIPVYDLEDAKIISNEKNWLILDVLRKCGSRGATGKEIEWLLQKEYEFGNHAIHSISASEINTRLNKELKDFVGKRRETRAERDTRINELDRALVSEKEKSLREYFGIERKSFRSGGIPKLNRLNRWYLEKSLYPDVSQVNVDFGEDIKEHWENFLRKEGDKFNKIILDWVKEIIKDSKIKRYLLPKESWCPYCKSSHEAEEFIYALILPVIHLIIDHNLQDLLFEQKWAAEKESHPASCSQEKVVVDDDGVGLEE